MYKENKSEIDMQKARNRPIFDPNIFEQSKFHLPIECLPAASHFAVIRLENR